jgi:hypothetical protein
MAGLNDIKGRLALITGASGGYVHNLFDHRKFQQYPKPQNIPVTKIF